MIEFAPGARIPVLGRTRNFSGDVVLICEILVNSLNGLELLEMNGYTYFIRNRCLNDIGNINHSDQFVTGFCK